MQPVMHFHTLQEIRDLQFVNPVMLPRYSGLNFDGQVTATLNRPSTVRGSTEAVYSTFISCAQVLPWNTAGCDRFDD